MILTRLKYETAEAHAATERIVDLPSRLTSREAYRRLLARFWGFYAPFEAQLAGGLGMHAHASALRERAHTPRLVRDLRAIGMPPDAIDALPRCAALPVLPSYRHFLGGWYVLEGATLGGQVVARQVRETLRLATNQGCSFFAAHGSQTGPMWRAFGALLIAAAPDSEAENNIVHGANETFAAFGRWISDRGMESLL